MDLVIREKTKMCSKWLFVFGFLTLLDFYAAKNYNVPLEGICIGVMNVS